MKTPSDLILIVGDDPGAARLEEQILQRGGFRTIGATTLPEVLRMLRDHDVDLVLLNSRLKTGETGLGLVEKLRSVVDEVPTIFVTSEEDRITALQALRQGVRDSILKTPEFLEFLPEAIRRVLTQVRTEQQLIESRALLEGVIDSAKDAIITIDSSQRITLFNPAAVAMFDCPAEQAIGRHYFFFLSSEDEENGDPVDLENSTQPLTHLLATPTVGIRSDGSMFPIEASVSRCKVRGRKFYTMLVRDVTERKAAQERITEQAQLLDQASDAIMVVDMAGLCTYWNRGAEQLYGIASQEAIGKPATSVTGSTGDTAIEQARRTTLEWGKWTGELTQTGRGNKKVTVSSRWTVLRDQRGQPRSILMLNTDVTERKQAEVEIQRAQRVESIGRLANGIAHDLNNVLTPILMSIDVLQAYADNEVARGVLSSLKSNAERGASMVKQVLAFARGVEGERVPLQFGHLVRELQKTMLSTFPKGIDIEADIPKDLPLIQGDNTQLYQVLMNLCVNARDAMPHGGSLKIHATSAIIDRNYVAMRPDAQPGRYVRLTVSDTGVGIPQEIQEHIFDPFFTTKMPGQGSGVGLATVMTIVRGHGGFLTLQSEVGRGTSFQLFLPAVDRAEGVEVEETDQQVPEGHGELVLIVDDEELIRDMLAMSLENAGYRVLTATEGTEAVALYAQHKDEIRVAIVDMIMPVLDGAATSRALWRMNPELPIIMTSGTPEVDRLEIGPSIWLRKPFNGRELLSRLADFLPSESIVDTIPV